MVTIAVAAHKPETQKRYRTLLANAGVETHYVTDLDDLTRCVKSRPVDLILFDLNDPKLSAPEWFDRARQDDDLGLTPVLWIGAGISASAAQAADAYRPGLHVTQFPSRDTLTEFISALIGRGTAEIAAGRIDAGQLIHVTEGGNPGRSEAAEGADLPTDPQVHFLVAGRDGVVSGAVVGRVAG